MMLNFTLRHALRHSYRHWRLNVAVLLCLTLASALLASLSGYTAAIATRELNQTLDEVRPAERNLLITGDRYTFSEELYEHLQERLGDVLKDRLVIRHATLSADPFGEGTDQKRVAVLLDVYSFNKLAENVRVVEGRLPAQVRLDEAEGSWRPPPIEAVIGAHAAGQSGYGVGDRLTASKMYHRLDIVGIVDPLDPRDDVWGEDLSAFAITTDTRDLGRDLNADAIGLPLIIAPTSMRSYYPARPVFPHEVSWRVTLNHHLISVDKAEALHSDLINLQTQSATRHAKTSTGLVQILADYLARLSRVRMALFLLTAQSLIFVLYTLTMFTSFVVDRSKVELATLSGRGASAWQITRVFVLESLSLVLPAALLLGPGLAQAAMPLWGKSTGQVMPGTLPREAWLLSGVAAGLGWLALVLPVFLAARRNVLGWGTMRAQPSQVSVAQKRYLDLYLLAFSGLLYWQLNQSGSFVMRAVAHRRLGNVQLADPLLLIGPTLLLIAIAMIFLRILPFLLRLLAWFFRHLPGLVLPLSVFRLARDPLQPSRVVLLVSLTTGLMLFTRIFEGSLAYSQEVLRSDALAQGISGALQLNALTLLLFSLTAFFLLHFFAAQGRGRSQEEVHFQGEVSEFSVLRAMGLSARQLQAILLVEGILVLLLGLLAGTIVGLGLSHMMIPYLSQALAAPLAAPLAEPLTGVTIERILVDWPAIARLYALLIAVYGSALVLLVLVLMRTGVRCELSVHPALWRKDE